MQYFKKIIILFLILLTCIKNTIPAYATQPPRYTPEPTERTFVTNGVYEENGDNILTVGTKLGQFVGIFLLVFGLLKWLFSMQSGDDYGTAVGVVFILIGIALLCLPELLIQLGFMKRS